MKNTIYQRLAVIFAVIAYSSLSDANSAVQDKDSVTAPADVRAPLPKTISFDAQAYFSTGDRPTGSLSIEYSHRSKDNVECAGSMMTRGAARTYEYPKESTSELINVYDEEPEFSISAIKSTSVDGNILLIGLYEVGFHRQYSTNVIETFRKTHYEARPGTAVTVQVLTLGLSALFAPKMSALQLIGCNDIEITDRSPNLAKRQPTGSYMTRALPLKHKLVITGFGGNSLDYIFEQDRSVSGDRIVKINLTDAITSAPKEALTKLTIHCPSCTRLSDTDTSTLAVLGTTVNISADFSDTKQRFLDAEIRRVEAERVEALRVVAEKSAKEKQEKLEIEKLKHGKQKQMQKKAEQEKNDRLFKL